MGIYDFVAGIGGTLSLFVGVSFLSIAELVEIPLTDLIDKKT
jgi:hypothetical protein